MYAVFELVITDSKLRESVADGGQPLIDLCRKEADTFDSYLRGCGIMQYEDGLAKWERECLAGYLYQKVRGRLEPEKFEPQDLPESPEAASG